MSRSWAIFPHVGMATRTSAGAATAGVFCAEYIDGQVLIHCSGLGIGAKLTPYRQSSRDGLAWRDWQRGATMTATGIRVMSAFGGFGHWARLRWVIATAAKFEAHFLFTD
jgi:hypothetical protein